jgi:DNA polymerase III subunit delta'
MVEMKKTVSLRNFIGNARAVEILKRAIQQDRVPHAMIFAGPAGIGKCTLAVLVAQRLNCLFPVENNACGSCPACTRIQAVLESRNLQCLSLKSGFCGSCPNCLIRTKCHPDIRLIEPEKTTIGIGQIREMISEIMFQPLEAKFRVVILDPAEQMRAEAHNSLLKTLEEPPSRTVMILVTTNPYMLLQTIRSRSRLLQFGEIPQDQIVQRLIEEGRPAEEARLAAALSGGSLAAAIAFNTKEYQEVRELALRFLELILKKGWFSEASGIASEVTKDKQFFKLWTDSAEALLQDIYYASTAPARIGQQDLVRNLQQLANSVPRSFVVSVIDAIRKLKSELPFNVNRQIALEAMFLRLHSLPLPTSRG